jgi:hypothetical protein
MRIRWTPMALAWHPGVNDCASLLPVTWRRNALALALALALCHGLTECIYRFPNQRPMPDIDININIDINLSISIFRSIFRWPEIYPVDRRPCDPLERSCISGGVHASRRCAFSLSLHASPEGELCVVWLLCAMNHSSSFITSH